MGYYQAEECRELRQTAVRKTKGVFGYNAFLNEDRALRFTWLVARSPVAWSAVLIVIRPKFSVTRRSRFRLPDGSVLTLDIIKVDRFAVGSLADTWPMLAFVLATP